MKKFIFFALLFLLIGCGQSSNGTTEISEEINDYLGITPYLPETDYQISTVQIEYSTKMENSVATKGEPFTASVEYKVSLDEIVDKVFLEAWEQKHPFE